MMSASHVGHYNVIPLIMYNCSKTFFLFWKEMNTIYSARMH